MNPADRSETPTEPLGEVSFRRLAEATRQVIWVSSLDGTRVLYVSPAYEEVWGRPGESLAREPLSWLEAVHADDRPRVRAALAAVAEGDLAPPGASCRVVRPDGTIRHVVARIFPLPDERGALARIAALAEDVTERRAAEASLAESRERLHDVLDSLFVFAGLFSPDGVLLDANRAPLEAAGLRREDAIGRPFAETYWWSYSAEAQAQVREVIRRAASGETVRCDLRPRVAGGRLLTVDSSFGPLRDAAGRVVEVVGSGVDVTERRQAEQGLRASLEEQEALLREIHHRVKNNLQLISSLLYLQSVRTADAAAVRTLDETRDRIRTLALVHERLYRSGSLARVDAGEYLRSVVSGLTATYKELAEGVDVGVESDGALLDTDTAHPCGLIVNELVTNALKHAFPSGRRGAVRVAFRAGGDGRFVLRVSDDGVGLPGEVDPRTRRSLGLELVRTLVRQLEAELTVERGGGTAFEVSFRP